MQRHRPAWMLMSPSGPFAARESDLISIAKQGNKAREQVVGVDLLNLVTVGTMMATTSTMRWQVAHHLTVSVSALTSTNRWQVACVVVCLCGRGGGSFHRGQPLTTRMTARTTTTMTTTNTKTRMTVDNLVFMQQPTFLMVVCIPGRGMAARLGLTSCGNSVGAEKRKHGTEEEMRRGGG